jgi:hypothetical protein
VLHLVFPKAGIFQLQPKKLFLPETVVFVNAAEVQVSWNMITSFLFLVADRV